VSKFQLLKKSVPKFIAYHQATFHTPPLESTDL